MAFTPYEFRKMMGLFATGVTVVTMVKQDGSYHGITVNSFTSVSLDPPLVLICIDKKTEAYKILPQAGSYCINFLSEELEYLSNRFAGREPENLTPFAGIPLTSTTTGAPAFAVGLGWADCEIVETFEGGDHVIFMAKVVDLGSAENGETNGNPLLYYKSQYQFLKQ